MADFQGWNYSLQVVFTWSPNIMGGIPMKLVPCSPKRSRWWPRWSQPIIPSRVVFVGVEIGDHCFFDCRDSWPWSLWSLQGGPVNWHVSQPPLVKDLHYGLCNVSHCLPTAIDCPTLCGPKLPHSLDDIPIFSVTSLLLSGNLTVCYWKWPIEIVDLPIKDGDFP